MAIGARNSDIMQQFLIEAIFIFFVWWSFRDLTLLLLWRLLLDLYYRIGNLFLV